MEKPKQDRGSGPSPFAVVAEVEVTVPGHACGPDCFCWRRTVAKKKKKGKKARISFQTKSGKKVSFPCRKT